MNRLLIFLTCGLLQTPLYAQIPDDSRPEEAHSTNLKAPSDRPLIFRDAPSEVDANGVNLENQAELDAVIHRVRELVREIAQSHMSPQHKQAALDELIRDNHYILSRHRTWLDWQQPQTVDSVSLLLEQMIFEIAADVAPTEQSREQVLENAPQHLKLDPNEAQLEQHYDPPLLAPVSGLEEKDKPDPVTLPKAQDDKSSTHPRKTASNNKVPAPQAATDRKYDDEEKPKVAVLSDAKATTDLHDDNTVLRNAKSENGDLVLFGALHLWAGGAIQYDVYAGDGLFTLIENGDSDSENYVRRGEGVVRASILDNTEVKIQYDFDADLYRNFYWRWLSNSTSQSITVGNQKEPLGLDFLVGNKFSTAMEVSAPVSAFASYRSMGIRYNGWSVLEAEDNPLPFKLWGDSRTYMTSSIGLFGQDIENSNDTDWAVTGRVSMGGNKTETAAFHLGVAASYRHGEYDRIAPRPEIQDANRIPLARPAADTLAQIALEAMYTRGSLHGQAEFYFNDYGGAQVDAQGWGTYAQVGWLFGGKRRPYEPRWGQWAPVDASNEHIFEVFGRCSFTHGNDDVNSSNDLGLLTLGGNWYYQRFRVSANLILASSERDIVDQNDGHALAVRLQYLF